LDHIGGLIGLPNQQDPAAPTPRPFGDTFESKGIEITNVYKSAISDTASGDVLFVETKEYSYVYLAQTDEFVITLLDTPVESIIHTAEANFVRTLGITHAETCELKVSVGVPYFVDKNQAGRLSRLSFCN
jgi:hypothetical protein